MIRLKGKSYFSYAKEYFLDGLIYNSEYNVEHSNYAYNFDLFFLMSHTQQYMKSLHEYCDIVTTAILAHRYSQLTVAIS